MITTLYEVKKSHGDFDGIAIEQPTVNFDSDAGYSVGFKLLVTDGTNWVCTDDTVGAAVWDQDTSKDIEINQSNRTLTEILIEYLFNGFYTDSYVTQADMNFQEPNIVAIVGAGLDDIFYVKDTVEVIGSKRNDGEYQVLTILADALTFSNPIRTEMVDPNSVTIRAQVFPLGLQAVAGRLSAYDVWDRDNLTPGITSESIGSYSYSGETVFVGGLAYPAELITGLSVYKRPKVI